MFKFETLEDYKTNKVNYIYHLLKDGKMFHPDSNGTCSGWVFRSSSGPSN